MKTKLIVLFMALSIITAYCYYQYTEIKKHVKIVSIIIDKTDSISHSPTTADILALPELNQELEFNELRVYISTINGFTTTNTKSFILSASPVVILDNPNKRKTKIKAFIASIQNYIDSLNKLPNGRDKSNIYEVIAKESNRLSTYNASNKDLYVFSDLAENSNLLSVYDPIQFTSLSNNTEIIQNRFTKYIELNDLTGLHIHFLFVPQTNLEDNRFNVMAKLFVNLFEAKGANVTYGNSLIP